MTKCVGCFKEFENGDYHSLTSHYIIEVEKSSSEHVKFLNKYIGKKKLSLQELETQLRKFFHVGDDGLQKWIKKRFVDKFYAKNPHPFILSLQNPKKSTLLGYVFEHQHFLRQWVRSCAFIIAKTDFIDVTKYEIENIITEFGGIPPDIPAHYEYLLRMGESLGVTREQILTTNPLPDTQKAIDFWQEQAKNGHWLETVAAMHSLELIAYRDIKDEGATLTYFDPKLFDSDDYTKETKNFLREGYEADVDHANEALNLVEKYAKKLDLTEKIQAVFIKSIEMFDIYLSARLERGKEFAL